MQTSATDTTADHLMDFLAIGGIGGQRYYFADLEE